MSNDVTDVVFETVLRESPAALKATPLRTKERCSGAAAKRQGASARRVLECRSRT